jgi:hypothetical protein
MTLHQPDPDLTERLLATCEECKAWYLAIPKGETFQTLRLPDGSPRKR